MRKPEAIEVINKLIPEGATMRADKVISSKRRVGLAYAHYQPIPDSSVLQLDQVNMTLFDSSRRLRQEGREILGWDQYNFHLGNGNYNEPGNFEKYLIRSTAFNGAGHVYGSRTAWIDMGTTVDGSLFEMSRLKPETLAASWNVTKAWAFDLITGMQRELSTVAHAWQTHDEGSRSEAGKTLREMEIRKIERLIVQGIPQAYDAFYYSCRFSPTYNPSEDRFNLTRTNITTGSRWSLSLPGHIQYREGMDKISPMEFIIDEPKRQFSSAL